MNGRDAAQPDWLFDGTGEPDETERGLESSLHLARWKGDVEGLVRAMEEPPLAIASGREDRAGRGGRQAWWRRGAVLAAAAAALGVSTWLVFGRAPATPWTLASGGAVRQGQWITTRAGGEVQLSSDIGHVTVGPESRVRMLRADKDEHRLELAEGSIEAFIYAPPRLFLVDTPSATAVDMGCAYKLDVAEDGSGLLRVTGGWVELQAEPLASRVPAGAICRIGADGSLGIPRFEDAPAELADAADRLDRGDSAALDPLLAAARPRDGLTLWHLLTREDTTDRVRVAERLATLVPPRSPELTVRALALDPDALEAWWNAVRLAW